MFVPRTIPKPEELEKLRDIYPEVDTTALHSFMSLLSVVRDAFDTMCPFFHKIGISQGRFCILMALFKDPKQHLGPAELATYLAVSPASVTGLVDGLVKLELVARNAHPSDRRKIVCSLTEKGKHLLLDFLPEHHKRVALVMENLSETERKTLNQLLGKISTGLCKVNITDNCKEEYK